MPVIPIILTGGSGTRLWPLSRSSMPKQFLSLIGEKTMLQSTFNRLKGIKDLGDEYIAVCNEKHKFLVADQLKDIDINNASIIVEPVPRNTAAAIYVASLQATINKKAEDTILLVLPSDHLIQDLKEFHKVIQAACLEAAKGKLVTLGVTPHEPNTEYGYILRTNKNSHDVERFIEKPGIDKAKEFLEDGRYLWNSGMFIFRADVLQEELSLYSKDIVETGMNSFKSSSLKNNFIELEYNAFSDCPDLSIDYALMEKTESASVIPLKAGWSDLGSWKELYNSLPKDKEGNMIRGDVLNYNTRNSFITSSDKLVVTIGIQDLNIINTPDALLITHKEESTSKDIKSLISELGKLDRKEKDNNRKVYRPWGWYDSLEEGEGFQVKRLSVTPGCSISLQKHLHRSEHWVVIKGQGRVTLGSDVFDLEENKSVFIPKETIHRLENTTNSPLEVIEVQFGNYLGEDDIQRFEDIFGRD